MRYATCNTWAEYFEKREGVPIHGMTIHKKLVKAQKIGKDGRDKLGRLFRNAYFSESDVREACADLLQPMPQADESGYFELEDIRYGTVVTWAHELGISNKVITARLLSASVQPTKGRMAGGQVLDFFSEPAVRAVCQNLLGPIPQSDKNGFFVLNGIRYGTVFGWSKELGISRRPIAHRLCFTPVQPVEGKDPSGQIQRFYPETSVLTACEDLIRAIPQADKNGLYVANGIRHRAIKAWSKEFGISRKTIALRLRTASVLPVQVRFSDGNIRDYYPEPAVREACVDFLNEMPMANKDGFFDFDGVRHGTVHAWSRKLGLTDRVIFSLLQSASVAPVKGKDPHSRPMNFWPEPRVLELCADLLDPNIPVCDKDGFADINGIRHGTVKALARLLGVSVPAIFPRLVISGLAPTRGKRKGHPANLYPEPAVRELCKDMIEKQKSNPKSE
jgi:hypothetical protein